MNLPIPICDPSPRIFSATSDGWVMTHPGPSPYGELSKTSKCPSVFVTPHTQYPRPKHMACLAESSSQLIMICWMILEWSLNKYKCKFWEKQNVSVHVCMYKQVFAIWSIQSSDKREILYIWGKKNFKMICLAKEKIRNYNLKFTLATTEYDENKIF